MLSYALVSQALGLSGASGTRAGWSLLAVAVAARAGYVALPPELLWLSHPGALVGFGVVLAFEWWVGQDEDLRELLGVVQYGLSAASGGLTMLALLDVPLQGVPEWTLAGGGGLLAVVTLGLRRRVHAEVAALESELFHPLKWVGRLEEGGVVGLLVAVFLAPVLALGGVVLAAVAGLLAVRAAHRLEARFRRPCPACGKAIRQEASRCPDCRTEVPVEAPRTLGLAAPARAALDTALERLGREGAQEPSRRVG
jgi:hypothetical protein